ncbi:MAG: hypothetical protein ISN29_02005 [Gammaproteobacteria bacterium AqS3]|nr:hypothetical protein [Gammaproteobacteria bacterium AqS3]
MKRHRKYYRNENTAAQQWELQGRKGAYDWQTIGYGKSYSEILSDPDKYVKPSTDHVIAYSRLVQAGITDADIVNIPPNIVETTSYKNSRKNNKLVHDWLKETGAPDWFVKKWKSEHQRRVTKIVQRQQKKYPAWKLTPERKKLLGI